MSTRDDYKNEYGDRAPEDNGITFPWIQLAPNGLFYADAKDRGLRGTGATILDFLGGRDAVVGKGKFKRDVVAVDTLTLNVIARRRRYLCVDDTGRQLAAFLDYDRATDEANRRGLAVRGHVQVLTVIPIKDRDPVAVVLTAKGIQSTSLWTVYRDILARLVKPYGKVGENVPHFAFTVTLGWGDAKTVGEFDYELRPVVVTDPKTEVNVSDGDKMIVIPPRTLRPHVSDGDTWAKGWERFGANSGSGEERGEPSRRGQDEERRGAGRDGWRGERNDDRRGGGARGRDDDRRGGGARGRGRDDDRRGGQDDEGEDGIPF